jgi:hypothetical protein
LKTRKGGLGKNGYPGGLVAHTEQSRQKLGKQIKEGIRLLDQHEHGANFRKIWDFALNNKMIWNWNHGEGWHCYVSIEFIYFSLPFILAQLCGHLFEGLASIVKTLRTFCAINKIFLLLIVPLFIFLYISYFYFSDNQMLKLWKSKNIFEN